MSTFRHSLPPFDRSSLNGFRTVKYLSERPLAESLTAPRLINVQDHRGIEPVSDELYNAFVQQFAYDPSPLNETIEWTDHSQRGFVWEKVSFDAGYDDDRTVVHLLLPDNADPPYKTVVYFPGLFSFQNPGPSDQNLMAFGGGPETFVVKSGFALAWPIYDESFERWHGNLAGLTGAELARARRTRMAHWRQDVGRAIDYLETRPDIDTDNLVYLGFSYGVSAALPLVAMEDRFKVAVLVSGGTGGPASQPELLILNYAPRVTIPVLMLNGLYDGIFPPELRQQPLFDHLGSPPEDKVYRTFAGGHWPLPRSEWIPETLDWLDKYLGPVN